MKLQRRFEESKAGDSNHPFVGSPPLQEGICEKQPEPTVAGRFHHRTTKPPLLTHEEGAGEVGPGTNLLCFLKQRTNQYEPAPTLNHQTSPPYS